nr:sarcosine oxidase subunit gamma [Mesobacterium pallidum]
MTATPPFAGLCLPLEIGRARIDAAELGQLTNIAPFRGKDAALATALQAAHGLDLPQAGQSSALDDALILWFGAGHVLLCGPAPDVALADHAALTAQTDGWAALTLSGPDAEPVLARLVPLDLSPASLGAGRTARSTIGHMPASITRRQDGTFLLMTFRSMAGTLAEDLQTAMSGVNARRSLG